MPSIVTTLAFPADPGLSILCSRAEAMGASVTRSGDSAEIHAMLGVISAEAAPAGVRITLSGTVAEELQVLQDAIDGFAEQAGLGRPDWAAVVATTPAATPSRLIAARVEAVARISPSYRRVRLSGDFSAFAKGGLHFRLLIGPEGAAAPSPDSEGVLVWPGGGIDCWHRPPYTVRAIDPQGRWIDTDIFLHDGGRVTEWTEDARPGDRVMLTGPGGRGVRQAGWLGLVGDETALPVLLRAIEAAGPQTQGHAMILIGDPADAQQVTPPPGLVLDWVLRAGGLRLPDLFRRLSPPAENRFVFFAGERTEAEWARGHAAALGLAAKEFHAAAYWTAGWVPPASQRQARGLMTARAE